MTSTRSFELICEELGGVNPVSTINQTDDINVAFEILKRIRYLSKQTQHYPSLSTTYQDIKKDHTGKKIFARKLSDFLMSKIAQKWDPEEVSKHMKKMLKDEDRKTMNMVLITPDGQVIQPIHA
jgi:hypothetical protein